EVAADRMPVPLPLVFGVGGRMNAYQTMSGLDPCLQGSLLIGIEDVARGAQEDDDLIVVQHARIEYARVLGRIHGKPVAIAQSDEGGDAVRDGRVPESGGLREDECLE